MDIQNLMVGVIILAALSYAGLILFRKTRSFSKKSPCTEDCGCSGKTENHLHNQI